MKDFTVVDLSAQCEIRQKATYRYELLEKIEGAPELIGLLAAQVWRSPDGFEVPLPETGGLLLRWRASAETAGIATVREGERNLSLSLLLSGLNLDADRITLDAFQRHFVRELHDTGFEPSFDLVQLQDRPLLATVGLAVPGDERLSWVFALADRCLAAAYLRRLGLA